MNALIQKKSLADELAGILQQQISSGRYRTGDKLPIEPELMKQFGVGRSTVREAIKILANSGLLRVQQGVGTFVEEPGLGKEAIDQRLQRADIRDLDEVRQLIEMKIAEKAATNRTEEDIQTIQLHLAARGQYAQEGQLEACIQADINFHIAIAEASGNDILADLYKSTSIHLAKWFLRVYKDTSDFIQTQHYHQELLSDIVSKDAKAAWSTAARIIGHISQ
jgi:DNA-binding FadR family transcriptional regulator